MTESAESRNKTLLRVIGLMDLTTLEGTDTDERVAALCSKAIRIQEIAGIGPAAVCVYPTFVKTAAEQLEGSGINVASVAGAFPSGQSPLHLRVLEVEYAVSNGADEIDMVISRGRFLNDDFEFVSDEIRQIKRACGKAHLKVILETGELGTIERIKHASQLAIMAGADFIKTSTGKIQPAATPEAMIAMLEVIKEVFDSTGKKIGIKPAGGISNPDQALQYYQMVEQVLGQEWLNPHLFRIGASRLADGILAELNLSLK